MESKDSRGAKGRPPLAKWLTYISERIENYYFRYGQVGGSVAYIFGTSNSLQASDYIAEIENKANLKTASYLVYYYILAYSAV